MTGTITRDSRGAKIFFALGFFLSAVSYLLFPVFAEAETVKTIQRGTLTRGFATYPEITLNPSVNPDNTLVLCRFRNNASAIAQSPLCELLNSTTLKVVLGTTDVGTQPNQTEWEVLEFDHNVKVQRDVLQIPLATATTTVTIESVDLTRAFVLITTTASSTSTTIDEEFTIRARLLNATTLELGRNETGIAVDVSWQVIEMNSASVQSNIASINEGLGTTTAALAPAVDVSRSFVVLTVAASQDSAGFDGQYEVRGELNAAGHAYFGAYRHFAKRGHCLVCSDHERHYPGSEWHPRNRRR